MSKFEMLLIFAGMALLVAAATSLFVAVLSSEKPRDLGRLWLEAFVRLLSFLTLGGIGWAVNHDRWSRLAAAILLGRQIAGG